MLLLTIVMSFEASQTFVAKKATTWLNSTYDLNTKIGGLSYSIPNKIVIKELYIPDEEGDTLIYAKKLKLNIGSYSSSSNSIKASKVVGENLKYYQLIKKGDSISNIKRFSSKFASAQPSSNQPLHLDITNIQVLNSNFRLENENCNNCTAYWLENLNTELRDFDLQGPYLTADIINLRADDRFHFKTQNVSGQFAYLKNEISLLNALILTPSTKLKGDFSLNYDSITDLKDFVNKVNIKANIEKGSTLKSEDIQWYAKAFPDFDQIEISGQFDGVVNNLQANDLKVKLAEQTNISGSFKFLDLTIPENLFISTNDLLVHSTFKDAEDLIALFTDSLNLNRISPISEIQFSGEYTGFLNDFRANGTLETNLGDVKGNIYFDNNQREIVAYQGSLDLNEFDLGTLLADTTFGIVSSHLKLDGEGFDPSEMQTKLSGGIERFDLRGYSYSNVIVDGSIIKGSFIGDLNINDPNVKLDFEGTASLNKDVSKYDFKAKLDSANLLALNLTKDSLTSVSSELDIKFSALNYDHWQGTIKVKNTSIQSKSNSFFFEDILVESNSFIKDDKFLNVRSNILDLDLRGEYTLASITEAFKYHFEKYASLDTISLKPSLADFTFDLEIKDLKVIADIFMPSMMVLPDSKINGAYKSLAAELQFELKSPGLAFYENSVDQIDLKYFSSEVNTEIDFNISSAQIGKGLKLDSLVLNNNFRQDSLMFNFKSIVRDSIKSYVDLNGFALKKEQGGYQFGLGNSKFNIGKNDFTIASGNTINTDTSGVFINGLKIKGVKSLVSIDGNLSRNPYQILRVKLSDFNSDLINYFIGTEQLNFEGAIYGEIIVSEALRNPRFATNLNVDSMVMNDVYLGDLNMFTNWSYDSDSIPIQTQLSTGTLKIFDANGYYVANKSKKLNMDLSFNRFTLKPFSPFISSFGENLRGFAEGEITLIGTLDEPILEGDLSLPRAGLKISVLQVDYNFVGDPRIHLEKNRFVLKDVRLRDSNFGSEGALTGELKHSNFNKLFLDLKIEAKGLLALNTKASTEGLYYGKAFVDGNVFLKGSPSSLAITANVKAVNSEFNLTLDAAREVKQSDFVNFVNPYSDTLSSKTIESTKISFNEGMNLDFNITVDKDSKVKVLWDQYTGTGLTSSGNGAVRLMIDQDQNIQMFGNYSIESGNYLLSLENVIKKDFSVERGGSVAWNGDPTKPIVDFSAKYATRADPNILVPDYDGGRTLVNVFMKLKGDLSDENISFDLTVPRAPASTQTFLTNRLADEDKMIQQVFSLLVIGSFAPDDGVSAGDIITESVDGFDFLASRANNWINQVTGDYNVNLGYQNAGSTTTSTDPDANGTSQEEVEIGVTKRFFNDRVTVNGRLGVAVGENQRSDQFAGDFEVEYNVTEDGRFRTKAFNRSVQDQYSFTQQNYQQGVGFFYQVNFNTWQELYNRATGKDNQKSKSKKDKSEKALKGSDDLIENIENEK